MNSSKIFWFFSLLFFYGHLFSQVNKAPAYPLIAHDPYFSIWSMSDTLNASRTKHWTGTDQSIVGMIKVDDKVYRVIGNENKTYENILSTSDEQEYTVKYIEARPQDGWQNISFNDIGWKNGKAPFSDNKSTTGTKWDTKDLWIRRTFNLTKTDFNNLFLKLKHDDNLEVYLNGQKIYEKIGWTGKFEYVPLNHTQSNLRKGKNVLAVHIANTAGGSFLDVGIVNTHAPQENAVVLRAEQKNVTMNATQTIYDFACGHVDATITFTSPLLLKDIDVLARPVSYITYSVKSNDGEHHKVQLYFGASANIAVNEPAQEVATKTYTASNLKILKAGTIEQPVLQKKGDDLRIDWGYMYVAVPQSVKAQQYVSTSSQAVPSFISKKEMATPAKGKNLVLNTSVDLGNVGSDAKEQYFLIGYDDIYSIQYFHQYLRPWWNRNGNQTIESQLAKAATDYKKVMQQCEEWNKSLYNDLVNAGGKTYANLCIIAYRQCIAAHKLLQSPQGEILFLSKENFSNGSINTVDVTYPSAPLFLAYNPELMKGMLNGIFYFSESGKWTKPFAAHDLGTYPVANGQTYGEGMPVEESGNMIILAGGNCKGRRQCGLCKETLENINYMGKLPGKGRF